jgi:hypothetical protein
MPSGVKIKDIDVGAGDEAVPDKTIVANVRMFLNHGTELTGTFTGGPRNLIDLSKRECIAGLRYGIKGMRVGGRRNLIISPHLAYGAEGVPGHVPPNAVIRCEVELLEVRESGVRKPEDYPPGKQLFVFHPGVAARNLPRWQFGLEEDGRCGARITHPVPGLHWRHTRHSRIEAHLDAVTTGALFENASGLPQKFPKDCLGRDQLWADMIERGNAITREKGSNALCLTIGVRERGQWLCYYSATETNRALLDSQLFRIVNGMVENHLKKE